MRLSFGDCVLDADRRELSRGGTLVHTGPRVFDLLAHLVMTRERVVTKDELLRIVWGGRLVSDSTLTSHIHAVRKAIGDSGDQQKLIRTVSRKGFRFVGEVKDGPLPSEFAGRRVDIECPEAELISAPQLPDNPSIAVLPFKNLSGDPDQEYFADGIVEEITTTIARLPWLFVIARDSSFTYKGKETDVREVARVLGVRYLLEGSVRKAGNSLRITAQLIDASTGAHIWAERFDGALDDIFALQDQVADSVAGALEPTLRFAEIGRASRKTTASLDAYDLYLRALAESRKPNLEGIRAALSLCRQALAIDPSYAPASSFIGAIRSYQWLAGAALTDDEIAEAVSLARHAIDTENNDSDVLSRSAHALALLAGEHAVAVSAMERATTLNPNSARAWGLSAVVNCYAYRPEAAIAAAQRAMRLSPLDPLGYQFKLALGYGQMLAGSYAEGLEWVDQSLNDRSTFRPAIRVKVALFGYLGRREEGTRWTSMLKNDPARTIASFTAFGSKFLSPRTLAVVVEGFRRAGVVEE
jgi:TolB-like protein